MNSSKNSQPAALAPFMTMNHSTFFLFGKNKKNSCSNTCPPIQLKKDKDQKRKLQNSGKVKTSKDIMNLTSTFMKVRRLITSLIILIIASFSLLMLGIISFVSLIGRGSLAKRVRGMAIGARCRSGWRKVGLACSQMLFRR